MTPKRGLALCGCLIIASACNNVPTRPASGTDASVASDVLPAAPAVSHDPLLRLLVASLADRPTAARLELALGQQFSGAASNIADVTRILADARAARAQVEDAVTLGTIELLLAQTITETVDRTTRR
jgi:hypothetical protein